MIVIVGQLVDDRRATVSPPNAGIENPDGRKGRVHARPIWLFALLYALSTPLLRARTAVGGEHAGDRAAQVALQATPPVPGQQAEQDTDVRRTPRSRTDHDAKIAGEEAKHDQEGSRPARIRPRGSPMVVGTDVNPP